MNQQACEHVIACSEFFEEMKQLSNKASKCFTHCATALNLRMKFEAEEDADYLAAFVKEDPEILGTPEELYENVSSMWNEGITALKQLVACQQKAGRLYKDTMLDNQLALVVEQLAEPTEEHLKQIGAVLELNPFISGDSFISMDLATASFSADVSRFVEPEQFTFLLSGDIVDDSMIIPITESKCYAGKVGLFSPPVTYDNKPLNKEQYLSIRKRSAKLTDHMEAHLEWVGKEAELLDALYVKIMRTPKDWERVSMLNKGRMVNTISHACPKLLSVFTCGNQIVGSGLALQTLHLALV